MLVVMNAIPRGRHALVLVSCAAALANVQPAVPTLAIHNVTLIDGAGSPPKPA
jgi:hypothetical protein